MVIVSSGFNLKQATKQGIFSGINSTKRQFEISYAVDDLGPVSTPTRGSHAAICDGRQALEPDVAEFHEVLHPLAVSILQPQHAASHRLDGMLVARIHDGDAVQLNDHARALGNDREIAPIPIFHALAYVGDLLGTRQWLNVYQRVL